MEHFSEFIKNMTSYINKINIKYYMQAIMFNEILYKKAKRELSSKKAIKIIEKYNFEFNLKYQYSTKFLSIYYFPIYTILKQFWKKFEGKNILEIGFRVPLFLDYLENQGVDTYGIDIEPYIETEKFRKESIEKLSKDFFDKNKNKFHAIIARITLSRLYDEKNEVETGNPMFKDKHKILLNIFQLLKPNGILILQDDRGSIFTTKQFRKIGFRKIVKEYPIIFKNKGKYLGWNVIVAYKKVD